MNFGGFMIVNLYKPHKYGLQTSTNVLYKQTLVKIWFGMELIQKIVELYKKK